MIIGQKINLEKQINEMLINCMIFLILTIVFFLTIIIKKK